MPIASEPLDVRLMVPLGVSLPERATRDIRAGRRLSSANGEARRLTRCVRVPVVGDAPRREDLVAGRGDEAVARVGSLGVADAEVVLGLDEVAGHAQVAA